VACDVDGSSSSVTSSKPSVMSIIWAILLSSIISSLSCTTMSVSFLLLLEKHFEKVQELFSKHPKKAADFTLLFKSVNTYLISDDHFTLFTETLRNITCNKNNISTKLFLWIVNFPIHFRLFATFWEFVQNSCT
jgi:hypothetical protein